MNLPIRPRGLSRAALIEAIYRASRIVSRTEYDFEKADTTSLSEHERVRVAEVVASIITDIEQATDFKIESLPKEKQEETLANLYEFLSDNISTGRASKLATDDLMSDLHKMG